MTLKNRNCHLPCCKATAETNYLFRFSYSVRLLCARNTSGTAGSECARWESLTQVSVSVTEISVEQVGMRTPSVNPNNPQEWTDLCQKCCWVTGKSAESSCIFREAPAGHPPLDAHFLLQNCPPLLLNSPLPKSKSWKVQGLDKHSVSSFSCHCILWLRPSKSSFTVCWQGGFSAARGMSWNYINEAHRSAKTLQWKQILCMSFPFCPSANLVCFKLLVHQYIEVKLVHFSDSYSV